MIKFKSMYEMLGDNKSGGRMEMFTLSDFNCMILAPLVNRHRMKYFSTGEGLTFLTLFHGRPWDDCC